MMDCKIDINKVNDETEMFHEKKAYYWLEKLSDVNFDMCINKIFNAEIEKLENKENDAKNMIKDIEKSIREFEHIDKK